MITVNRAKKLLTENTPRLEGGSLELKHALGFITAQDIYSPIDLPPFENSAMDGYAVRSCDVASTPTRLKLIGEIQAGDNKDIRLKKGEAVRIFTGAQLPDGADCVVMQEYTRTEDGFVIIEKAGTKNDNIRRKGEETHMGSKVFSMGNILNPPAIALMANIGLSKVDVIKKPIVHLTVTGNEIVAPGTELKPGEVYDSNSFAIRSALESMGITDIGVSKARDSLPAITGSFEKAVSRCDALIFTGGISVGKYDLVGELFEKAKVETVFYKVLQKPGKPLYFGKLGNKLVFGLPGNPVSSLVCFYEYVYPALRMMSGHTSPFMKEKTLALGRDIKDARGKVNFLRGKTSANGTVRPLKHQHSHMLSSFAEADCLIAVPQNTEFIAKGDKVKVHMLPHSE